MLVGVELEDDEGVHRRVVEQAGAEGEEEVHLTLTGRLELGKVHVDRVEPHRPGGLAEVVHGETWFVEILEVGRLELHQ